MKKNSFTVTMSIVVLAMLIPAVALANSHQGYSYATVTPTTVAPGGTITVEFEYTVTISESSYNGTYPNTYSLWEIRLDANYDRSIPRITWGYPWWGAEWPEPDGQETFYVYVDVTIPEDTEDGEHTIDIYSVPWSYQSAWYGKWSVITINVEEDDPVVLIQNLIDTVADMNLQQGIDNSLDAKLDAAFNALDDVNNNNDVAAINSLNAFINAVEAQRGNKITDEQANELNEKAQAIIAALTG